MARAQQMPEAIADTRPDEDLHLDTKAKEIRADRSLLLQCVRRLVSALDAEKEAERPAGSAAQG